MAEQTKKPQTIGLSTRWKLVASGGIIAIVAATLLYGFWAGLATSLVFFAILSIGKPFRRFRKFVYRAVCPAGALTLGIGWALDMILQDLIPDPLQRLFVALATGLLIGITSVFLLRAVYAEMRLHWVTTLSTDIDKKTARTLLRNLFLELNYPIMVVEDGQATTTREAGPGGPGGLLQRFGGPGLIFVNHGNAVVLERAGKYTGIARAGLKVLKLYERPKAVVNLRPQGKTIRVEDVYTRDGVALSFDLGVFYQIRRAPQPTPAQPPPAPQQPKAATAANVPIWRKLWQKIRPAVQQPPAPASATAETVGQADLYEIAQQTGGLGAPSGEEDRFPVADQDLVNAVYSVFSWQGATEAVAAYILRDVIAERNLDSIYQFDPTQGQLLPRAEIRQEVMRRLNELSQQWWGTEVTWVDIGTVSIPTQVRDQLLSKWLADWEAKVAMSKKQATIAEGEAEAAALSAQETARARAQMQMINTITQAIAEMRKVGTPSDVQSVIALRLIEALEKMATEHTAGFFLPVELLQMLAVGQVATGGTAPPLGGTPPPTKGSTSGGSPPPTGAPP